MIYALGDRIPTLSPSCWVAPTAVVVGDVRIEDDASIWWGAVLRAEAEAIRIGRGANVQDNAVLHVDPGFPLTLEEGVTVGHLAMVHGCTVGQGSLIGIGATVLNGARIGRECLIGAGALVPEGMEIPDRSMVLGTPARVVRTLHERDLARLRRPAETYRARWREYRGELRPLR